MMSRSPVWPPLLKKGGTIGICSPSSPSPQGSIPSAARALEAQGYKVVIAPNAESRNSELSYLAGSDAERLADINGLLRDPDIDLVLCARGGYGAGRLLDGLDYEAIRQHPKLLVGYSDITALSLGIAAQTGVVTFSGIMATGPEGVGSATGDPFSVASFWEAVGESPFPRVLSSPSGNPPWQRHHGSDVVTGSLYPVCLSLLMSLWGTPYVPDLTGAILLIEDVHEELYRIDRFLTQLRLAGVLDSLAAVLIGSFNGMSEEQNAELSLRIPEMLLSMTGSQVTIASGVAYGHIPCRLTIPVGATATVNMMKGTLTFQGSVETK